MSLILKSNLQVRQMEWHANMTEEKHLQRAMLAKPEVFEGATNMLYAAHYYSQNPLTTLSQYIGNTKTIESGTTWSYSLRPATTRPLLYMGAAATGEPGKGRSEFNLPLSDNDYRPGDIIHPGNPSHQVRVQRDGVRQGGVTIYRVVPIGKDANYFMPLKYLTAGVKWSKLYSKYEEGAEQGGSTQYALPINFIGSMSRMRKQYSVTGDAAQRALAISVTDSRGRTHVAWQNYAEVEFDMQFAKERDYNLLYSVYEPYVEGSTGRPIISGAGLLQVADESVGVAVNRLNVKLLEEVVGDLHYSKVAPGAPGREVWAFTGEQGMINISDALTNKVLNSGWSTVQENLIINKTSSPYHTNALEYGGQITRYKGPNGSTINFVHMPAFDDPTQHTEINPRTGRPYESERILIVDVAPGAGAEGSNISLVRRKGSLKKVYTAGTHNPYGPANNTLGSHTGDYYTMLWQDDIGVQVNDFTRMVSLYPNRA